MTRVIYETATSLNGWIADENNSLDWLFAAGPAEQEPDSAAAQSTVIVEGSTTYEWVLRHEELLEHPEKWQQYFGTKPTFVFTTRSLLVPKGADVRFVTGDVAAALGEIYNAAGRGNIWLVGGGGLAGQFLDAGALDEIALTVAPVALAGGAALLPRRVSAQDLRLVSAHATGRFARLVYEVRRTSTR